MLRSTCSGALIKIRASRVSLVRSEEVAAGLSTKHAATDESARRYLIAQRAERLAAARTGSAAGERVLVRAARVGASDVGELRARGAAAAVAATAVARTAAGATAATALLVLLLVVFVGHETSLTALAEDVEFFAVMFAKDLFLVVLLVEDGIFSQKFASRCAR